MKKFACVAVAILGMAPAARAGDPAPKPLEQWPHWRGPLATGAAPHGDPPTKWDEKTNIKWKTAIPGKGSATAIIWGDRVFIATAVDTKRVAKAADIPRPDPKREYKTKPPNTYHQFILMCLDRQTGKVRWEKVCTERVPHEGVQANNTYASGSPTTDGKFVWVSFGSQGVYCYDFAGTLQWQRDLGVMQSRYGFGEASTPVLHGDNLILNWDQEIGSKLVILDATNGKTCREIDRDEVTSWNTPLVVEHKGKTQVIVNGTKKVRSYDLTTGELLWQCGGMSTNAIPSPVAADGVAYVMSGYNKFLAIAVPLDATGDLTNTDKLLWKHTRGTPYCASPLLVDSKLYFTQFSDNLLTCLDGKTGKVYINQERLDAATSFYGSPVAAGGRIYLVDRGGVGVVLKQSTKVEVLATNRLNDTFDSSPAVAGRQLFLRGHKNLYCIEDVGK
jgi:outer membrane protein assembly factor BamB